MANQWLRFRRSGISLGLVGLTVLGLISTTTAETRTGQQVGPGDAVRLRVWDAAQTSSKDDVLSIFSGDYVVDGKGNILVPRLGSLSVVGKSMSTIEKEIEEKLAEISKRPVVVARPLIRVLIWGAVKEPGSYLVEPESALWEAIQLGGGPEMGANLQGIYVRRGRAVVLKGLQEAFRAGQSLSQIGVRSGDIIVIPYRRQFSLRTLLEYSSYLSTLVLLYLRIREGY